MSLKATVAAIATSKDQERAAAAAAEEDTQRAAVLARFTEMSGFEATITGVTTYVTWLRAREFSTARTPIQTEFYQMQVDDLQLLQRRGTADWDVHAVVACSSDCGHVALSPVRCPMKKDDDRAATFTANIGAALSTPKQCPWCQAGIGRRCQSCGRSN